MSARAPHSPPVVCTLACAELGDRRQAWQRLADTALRTQDATPSGVELTYRPEDGVETRLRQLASLEAECCSFARWVVRRREQDLQLTVTTAPESVAALHDLFGRMRLPDRG